MSNDELEQLCRRSWGDEYIYLRIDKSKKQSKGKIVIVMKAKTHVLIAFQKPNLLINIKVILK